MKFEDLVRQKRPNLICPICGSVHLELKKTWYAKWFECLDCGYSSNPTEEREEDTQ